MVGGGVVVGGGGGGTVAGGGVVVGGGGGGTVAGGGGGGGCDGYGICSHLLFLHIQSTLFAPGVPLTHFCSFTGQSGVKQLVALDILVSPLIVCIHVC